MQVNPQPLNEWLDSSFLLVKDVQENDLITVEEIIGLVDSFGKQKFQLTVNHNGKKKILNLNKVQYRQMQPIERGRAYLVNKVSINGGSALNYKPLGYAIAST